MAVPFWSSLGITQRRGLRGIRTVWRKSRPGLIKSKVWVFGVRDATARICPPFAVSARESLVCLLHMTSFTEYETFPINLSGPQGFQPLSSGNRQCDYEDVFFVLFLKGKKNALQDKFYHPECLWESQTCQTCCNCYTHLFISILIPACPINLFGISLPSLRVSVSLSPLRAESCEAVRSLSSHKFSQSPLWLLGCQSHSHQTHTENVEPAGTHAHSDSHTQKQGL